jgi:hypothetical protein
LLKKTKEIVISDRTECIKEEIEKLNNQNKNLKKTILDKMKMNSSRFSLKRYYFIILVIEIKIFFLASVILNMTHIP